MELIKQITNKNILNTTKELKKFKKENPLSYAFLCFENCLNNSGMTLTFMNQDKNRIYFKIFNTINKKTSYIMDLNFKELLNLNIYDVDAIKSEAWIL